MADHDGHPDKDSARRFVDDDIRQKGHHDDPKGQEGEIERVVDGEAALGPPDVIPEEDDE